MLLNFISMKWNINNNNLLKLIRMYNDPARIFLIEVFSYNDCFNTLKYKIAAISVSAPSGIFEIFALAILLIFWPSSVWYPLYLYGQLSLSLGGPNYHSYWIIVVFDDNFVATISASRDISIKNEPKKLLFSIIVIKCSIVYFKYRNNYETIAFLMHY